MSNQKKVLHAKETPTFSSSVQARPEPAVRQPLSPLQAYQRVRSSLPVSSPDEIYVLQHTLGNHSMQKLLGATAQHQDSSPAQEIMQPVQRKRNTRLPDELQTTMLELIYQEDAREHIIQRKVSLDLEAVPPLMGKVHIIQIDRPTTPDTSNIPGVNAANPAARHIIPQALLTREFKARYNNRTVGYLQTYFPSVAINKDYLINLAAAMQRAFTWENMQLNRGGGVPNPPEGVIADASRQTLAVPAVQAGTAYNVANPGAMNAGPAGIYRNFWEGDQAENLMKDILASDALNDVVSEVEQQLGVYQPGKLAQIKFYIRFNKYKGSEKVRKKIIKAISQEFDPPPFASQATIRAAAEEWARLTNAWLSQDEMSRYYYGIARPYTWKDAVAYGDNHKVYQDAQ